MQFTFMSPPPQNLLVFMRANVFKTFSRRKISSAQVYPFRTPVLPWKLNVSNVKQILAPNHPALILS